MLEELQTLMCQEIPEGRQSIKDSHTNLEKVAEYCEANYFQAENKTQALEESKRYTTQSLASVAYQINTLAFNLLHLLDLQTTQLASVESQVNHIAQTVSIHKEKVARREIGVLTTNKNTIRQHKILAPANQEKPVKYVRKPIDYSALDNVGHASRILPANAHGQVQGGHHVINYSQTAPRARRSSSSSSTRPAGPAPTQKPPTPPGQQVPGCMVPGGGGTLRRGDYRSTPPIAPPQLPSNYAPNYPMGSATMGPGSMGPRRSVSNCSTLPHPHASAMVHNDYLVQQQQQQQQQQALHQQQMMSHYRQGMMAAAGPGGPQVQHHPEAQHMMAAHQMSMVPGHPNTASHYGPSHGHPMQPAASAVQMSAAVQRTDILPAPPANMMAPAAAPNPPPPPPAVSIAAGAPVSSANVPPPGGNISPPLPPPPEELASPPPPPTTANSGAAAAPTAVAAGGQRGSTSGEPAWAPANYLEKVVAIYDYQADKADELSFAENALIYVIKKNDDGWYEGVMDGVQGLFPGNYVEPYM